MPLKTAGREMHVVNTVYHPERPGEAEVEEAMPFSTASAALAFVQWQKKKPSVKSCRLMPTGSVK